MGWDGVDFGRELIVELDKEFERCAWSKNQIHLLAIIKWTLYP